MTRAAIYARYSSEQQREASIDDDVRNARALCERQGWIVVRVYEDRAISGATLIRPGYQEMLREARDHAFDVLVCEGLDRLSRVPEHTARVYSHGLPP